MPRARTPIEEKYFPENCETEDKLLPCPFCGSDEIRLLPQMFPGRLHGFSVNCERCYGRKDIHSSVLDQVVHEWNQRDGVPWFFAEENPPSIALTIGPWQLVKRQGANRMPEKAFACHWVGWSGRVGRPTNYPKACNELSCNELSCNELPRKGMAALVFASENPVVSEGSLEPAECWYWRIFDTSSKQIFDGTLTTYAPTPELAQKAARAALVRYMELPEEM